MALLLVANGAPILARNLFKHHGAWPLDFGYMLRDQRHFLGPTKTYRGVLASIVACAFLAPLLGISWALGAQVGLWAMVGDAICSFLKRRLGLESSMSAPGLDQGIEALVPLVLLRHEWGLRLPEIIAMVCLFAVLDILISRLLYKIGIRKRPM